MHISRLASGLLAAAALLVAAPAAFADTLCVNSNAAGCELTYGANQLQDALNEAAAASEPDTVRIGAGTYTGAFSYNGASSSDTIEGEGPGTKIRASQNAVGLSLDSAGSTVRNLTLESGQDGSVAIAIGAGTLRDAWISTAAGVINARAAQLSGSQTVVDNVVVGSNASSLGIVTQGSGSPTIEDSKVTGASEGILAQGPSSPDVRRARIEGADGSALHARSGSINVSDSLVLLGSGDTGLFADDNGDPAARSSSIIADRVTVAALPGATDTRGLFSNSSSSGDQMWMWVKNSVLAGIDRPYRCLTSGGETLLTLEYVHRTEPAGADATSCSQVFEAHRVTGALDFVDPAAKDFHLRATSGLIDAADPAAASSGITDLDGFQRGNDGDGANGAGIDVGAYEYGRRQPSATASASGAAAGAPAAFTATGSDPDSGDTLTYAWAFDDGGTATGASVTHVFATAGQHTGTVTVTDPSGRFTQATATVTIAPALEQAPPKLNDDTTVPDNPRRDTVLPEGDRIAPAIGSLTIDKRGRARFRLSEAATVELVFQRGKSRKRVVLAGKAGQNVAKLGGRKLKPGRYRLTVMARDAAGNRSAAVQKRFKVKRKR